MRGGTVNPASLVKPFDTESLIFLKCSIPESPLVIYQYAEATQM